MDNKRSSSFFTKLFPLSLFLFLFLFISQSSNIQFPTFDFNFFKQTKHASNPCTGRYIYMYDLPTRFNIEILRDCKLFMTWIDMCPLIQNSGLGPEMNNTGSELPETGWFSTNQWVLEIIFHNRMMQYDCLTTNYSQSSVVYIPYYIGLDIMRYLWEDDIRSRDNLTNDLINWLKGRPEWIRRGGKDHLLLSGRTAWDHVRYGNEGWGGKFLQLPEARNVTLLLIESSIWSDNQFAIPYPTYFHPLKESEVVTWQEKVRSMDRKSLFSFVGARRPESVNITFMRNFVIDQCAQASLCNHVDCEKDNICHSPSSVMSVFMSSTFCLQPPGDTSTRRSTFDSMLAGCIPVFFHPTSAYNQYKWYFPKNFNKFSVYIPEDAVKEKRVIIQDVLLGYSEEQIIEMREEVIRMIPRLVYKDPRFKSENFQDAFDVAIDGVINVIEQIN